MADKIEKKPRTLKKESWGYSLWLGNTQIGASVESPIEFLIGRKLTQEELELHSITLSEES